MLLLWGMGKALRPSERPALAVEGERPARFVTAGD
jgi:hypothetical protein